jgi:hypothetical protein
MGGVPADRRRGRVLQGLGRTQATYSERYGADDKETVTFVDSHLARHVHATITATLPSRTATARTQRITATLATKSGASTKQQVVKDSGLGPTPASFGCVDEDGARWRLIPSRSGLPRRRHISERSAEALLLMPPHASRGMFEHLTLVRTRVKSTVTVAS